MKKLIFALILIILPLIFLPMLQRKKDNKDYLPLSASIQYLSNYSTNSNLMSFIKERCERINELNNDGYNFGDITRTIPKVFAVMIASLAVPVDIVVYYINFISFYHSA